MSVPSRSRPSVAALVVGLFLVSACGNVNQGTGAQTVAMIPGYSPGASPPPTTGPAARTVTVGIGETDATHMYIHLSSNQAPSGKTTFVVTNEGTKTHEFVVLASTPRPRTSRSCTFEGEANRIDEDAKGVTNVGETGDMEPGTTMLLTIDLASGPLRRGLQPARSLRHGHARGLLRDRRHPGHRRHR